MRITVESYKQKARSPDYDRATRVEFASAAWANTDGHAQFPQGVLAEILSIGDRPASASDVSHAIAIAKKRGGIGAESCARCLTVDHKAVDQGMGQTGCFWHGIQHVWDE